jgi:Ser/Thr protein kinase RdoA (MazF antagonist)
LFLTELAKRVRGVVEEFAARGLDWGPIHGDATLDNLHITEDYEIVLFDFDMGGPGYRAADLQGWATGSEEHKKKWDAFHRGYTSVRTLNEANLLAAPFLTVAWDIWGMKIDLDRRVLKKGRERIRQYLDSRIENLRGLAVSRESTVSQGAAF